MENLTEKLKGLDKVLIASTLDSKEQIKDAIKKQFNQLFNSIDKELKLNEQINQLANDIVEMNRVLNYDVKDMFTHGKYYFDGFEDIPVGEEFDQVGYDGARAHYQNWSQEKAALQDRIEKLKNQKLFKAIAQSQIKKLEQKIQDGDKYFNWAKAIFDEEAKMNAVDKVAVKTDMDKKRKLISSMIEEVIDKHILETVSKDSLLVAYDVFLGKQYPAISTTANSNMDNRNLYSFFDSRAINQKLSKILSAYTEENLKEVTSSGAENSGTEMSNS